MANLFSSVTSIFDLIRGRTGPVDDQSSYGQFFIATSGITTSGESVNVDNLLEDATVVAGINAVSGGISQIPMQVRRKTADGGSELLPNHPVAGIFMRPNAYQTPSEFKKSIVTSIFVHGNAFINIIRSSDGAVRQLVPMDASQITVGANGMGMPAYTHEEWGPIPMDDIIHIRDVSNYAPQGISRLLAAAERIGALRAADKQIASVFRNGVNVGYVATFDGQVNADQQTAFEASMSSRFGKNGTNNGGVTMLPAGSSITAVKGSTPGDADLRSLRQDLIREIAAVFGVPASMLGTDGGDKYNNLRQRITSFHRDTLNPIMVAIEEAFTAKLLTGTDCVHFDVVDFLKGALNEQGQFAAQMVTSGVYSVNEARNYMGLNPVESDEEFDYDKPIPPNSSSTSTESVSETTTGGEDGSQSLANRPEREEQEQ